MRRNYAVWIGLFAIAALVTLASKFYAHFPGDVAVERWVQSLLPQNLKWTEGISRTAEFPWIGIILAFIFALSWVLAGWRAALISIVSFVGMLALGIGLARSLDGPALPGNWSMCSDHFPAIASLPYLP